MPSRLFGRTHSQDLGLTGLAVSAYGCLHYFIAASLIDATRKKRAVRGRERNTCIIHRLGIYSSQHVLLHKPSVTCQAATETQPVHCCRCYCFQASRVCTRTHAHTHAQANTQSRLLCKMQFFCNPPVADWSPLRCRRRQS